MASNSSFRACLRLEVLTERCLLSTFTLGPDIRVSHGDPFKNTNADDIQHQSGTLYPGTAMETWMVVDPTNQDHIVGMWQQDRWSNGGCRGLMLGISFDGGQTWFDEPLPGVSKVAGGTAARASDPWLAFAPNGDLFAAALTVTAGGSPQNCVVVKSTDGGFTWQTPVTIPNSNGADKESIICDPSDPNYAYVVFTGAYSRTTDGGRTWSAARSLPTGSGSQIVVLPDGTLVDSDAYEVYRSTDRGQSWGSRIIVGNFDSQQVIDPNTHQPLRAGLGLGDIAVDPNTGAIYIVVEDTGVGGGRDGVAFTVSLDGGLHWSRAIKANQTPTNIPPLDQQAFIPTVQVAADGTVGVTYYDFRFNQNGPALLTDYWFVSGTPDGSGGITWGDELRLTGHSFDFEKAPFSVYGKFVGDYQGHGAAGNDLLSLFGHPHGKHGDDIYFRRAFSNGPSDAGGNAGITAQQLAAVLPASQDGTTSTITVTSDSATGQSGTVDGAALTDSLFDSGDPFAIQFNGDGQGIPLSVADMTMATGALNDELEVPAVWGGTGAF
jgi:hypothetical protein